MLCYSRKLFFQCYPTFRSFDCKVFLTEALRYFSGAAARVIIDNTHVVVLRGTEREMIPVPEMEAFGDRFGFRFAAHELRDAGYTQFGKGPDIDYDLVWFDLKLRDKNGDCRILKLDHEEILCNSRRHWRPALNS